MKLSHILKVSLQVPGFDTIWFRFIFVWISNGGYLPVKYVGLNFRTSKSISSRCKIDYNTWSFFQNIIQKLHEGKMCNFVFAHFKFLKIKIYFLKWRLRFTFPEIHLVYIFIFYFMRVSIKMWLNNSNSICVND